MIDIKRAVIILLGCFVLAGCDPQGLPPSSRAAICAAVVGPIRYNSTDRQSGRYAARLLVPDLKQRNQIGRRLGCPQYR
jgi:hypothetical protein